MIISASYKTDIPTFYGKWFLNRLNAGYCKMRNPYNRQLYEVKLTKDYVDGFVFWTKNLGPFMDVLGLVHDRGFPFIVQYTINGYPRELECAVVDYKRSIEHITTVSKEYGNRVSVWRYDPIIISSLTPVDFHIKNFTHIAQKLDGITDEVVISFAQIYRKTERNLELKAEQTNLVWSEPEMPIKIEIINKLSEIASDHGMALSLCSQRELLKSFSDQRTLYDEFIKTKRSNVKDSVCVDAIRLSDVAGYKIEAEKKGHRKDCGCYQSKDIGEYDTCPHGCVYCYAVNDHKLAKERFRKHKPESELLFE